MVAPGAALEDVFWLTQRVSQTAPEPMAKMSIMALMQMKDCVYTKDRSSVCLMRWFSVAQIRIKWPLALGKTCNRKASDVFLFETTISKKYIIELK